MLFKRIRGNLVNNLPRLIFWEITSKCNLKCIHCRGQAEGDKVKGIGYGGIDGGAIPAKADKHELPLRELSLPEMKRFIDQVASFAKPIMVLTGGEPLYREDIFELADYISKKGLRTAIATNGTLITPDIAKKIKDSGVMRVSISLDGSNAKTHDEFRKQAGSFDKAIEGAKHLLNNNVELQINTTVTTHNVDELPQILEFAKNLGAKAFHMFLLVPVGCGLEIAKEKEISPQKYEEVLNWFYEKEQEGGIELKATCAPHYYRIARQKGSTKHGRGCLAGSAVCFVSHIGQVQPCGYLPVSAGNILEQNFKDIWESSKLFLEMRDPSKLKGKCGQCEYRVVCMGCRARAYGETKDYLNEEPYCVYEPKRVI